VSYNTVYLCQAMKNKTDTTTSTWTLGADRRPARSPCNPSYIDDHQTIFFFYTVELIGRYHGNYGGLWGRYWAAH